VPANEHWDEVGHACVSKEVLADALELAMHDLSVERLELARNIVLGLLHPLLERCVNRVGRQGLGLLVEFGQRILT